MISASALLRASISAAMAMASIGQKPKNRAGAMI
jgi:hypothetical protein